MLRVGILLMAFAAAAPLLVLEEAAAQAPDSSQYLFREDRFSADFPVAPAIHESTYTTELGVSLPARVYRAEDDFGTYSVTVVDWRDSEALYETFLSGCQDCDGAMANDIRGAMIHAAFGFVGRASRRP